MSTRPYVVFELSNAMGAAEDGSDDETVRGQQRRPKRAPGTLARGLGEWPGPTAPRRPTPVFSDLTANQSVIKQIALTMIALLILAGCSIQPAPQPARLTIRTAPDPNACPAGGLLVPMRFKIDPSAHEQVVAIASTGTPLLVWWAPGFQAGDVTDPVVRDPKGVVVARDGELLDGPRLHGYQVCATADSIYVLLV
jgi:hypothetical protein